MQKLKEPWIEQIPDNILGSMRFRTNRGEFRCQQEYPGRDYSFYRLLKDGSQARMTRIEKAANRADAMRQFLTEFFDDVLAST